MMIIITGAAGFIGSALAWRLNQLGRIDLLLIDDLGFDDKWKNLSSLKFRDYMNKHDFIKKILAGENFDAEAIIHMGANSSTTEKDAEHLIKNNYEYTKLLAQYSVHNNTRFIYASSAATYGDGSLGFNDTENDIEKLRPLNMYGYSKQLFDLWAMKNKMLDKIVGIKYFNVYGPNEYHKAEMRSVVNKAFYQIKDSGKVTLFKSLRDNYKDGEQRRDFVYIKDAVDMTLFFLEHKDINGIFNIGSGKSRTWIDLVTAIFTAMDKTVNIKFIDLPAELADKYQYFTEADLTKIRKAGYASNLMTLEEGVTDYVKNYLLKGVYLD